ncbi:MAG: tetratricopeptide repeat protein [Acidobacteria bacterium]|nr:tetratricopeptide repeat protein [Acidobacteriota bacterium]
MDGRPCEPVADARRGPRAAPGMTAAARRARRARRARQGAPGVRRPPGRQENSKCRRGRRRTAGTLVGRVVAVCLLFGAGDGWAAGGPLGAAATSQGTEAEGALLPVVLPDLSRVHETVREQLREAHASLTALASEGVAGTTDAVRSGALVGTYGDLGRLLMASEYLDEAERCFRNAQRLAPDDFRWPYYLGHLARSKGRLPAAVEHFEQALRLRPNDLAALIWLGLVYIDDGRPDAAVPVLARARSLHPGTQAILFQLGRAAVAQRDYATAVELLEETLNLNPAATTVHYPLAIAYRGLGDLEQAQFHLERSGGGAGDGAGVAVPDPLMAEVGTALRSPQVYWDLGLYAGANGDWPEAVRQFRSAVEMAPGDPTMRLNLGLALNRTADARAAMDEFEEAVRLDPGLARAHFAMGTLLERSGRYEEAIDRYTAAVTHDPNLSEAHLRLADVLRRTDRLDASLASYEQVLALEPRSREARFGEAMALVRLARHLEALERLRSAAGLYPDESAFPLAAARLLAASPDPGVRNGQEALGLTQALAEQHDTTALAETMAMALAELGRYTEAMEWQRRAMAGAAAAGRADVAQRMAANLAMYRSSTPSRTPWRDDDPEHRPGPPVEPGLLDR